MKFEKNKIYYNALRGYYTRYPDEEAEKVKKCNKKK